MAGGLPPIPARPLAPLPVMVAYPRDWWTSRREAVDARRAPLVPRELAWPEETIDERQQPNQITLRGQSGRPSRPVMVAAFGVALRRHRERLVLTQEALAHQAGISVRTIRDLERGRVRRPRAVSVRLLSDALHLNDERRFEFDALALSDRPTAQPADRPAPPQPPLDAGGLAGRSAAWSILDGAVEAGSGHGRAVISYVAGMAGIGKTTPAAPWPYRVACRLPDGQLRLVLDWKDDRIVCIEILDASQHLTKDSLDQAEEITNQ
jgi:transcriptional regulator with XRE-family HTH domain